MALTFYSPVPAAPNRVALFPGAYNPPTIAHVAIAESASGWAEAVIWVLPRSFPHKLFECTTFPDRIALLKKLVQHHPKFAVASAQGGLYAEMAEEAREWFGKETEIALLCGRDAAHRIATWDYDEPAFFASMLRKYPLLVAARQGQFVGEESLRDRIICLPVDEKFDAVSSTEVRERIRNGQTWRELVPEEIADDIERLYASHPEPGL